MAKIHKHNKWKLFSPVYAWTWLLFAAIWLIGKLPHKAALKVGQYVGKFLTLFFPKRKYIIKTNLKLCFPNKSDKEIDKLVNENIQSLTIGACETAIAWYGSEKSIQNIAKIIEIENEHLLEDAYKNATADEPLILITPHTMSQELLSRYMTKKYDYAPVFRHMKNPVANYLMQKARQKIYKHLILKADTRNIIRTIKENKIKVGILPDQDFGRRRSVFVPFFGVPAATTTSLTKYKKLTNAKMIVGSYRRVFNSNTGNLEKFVITFYPVLDISGTDTAHDARQLNQTLEQIISQDITAYFWIAKKFKTRPEGEPKIYNYKSRQPLKYLLNYLKPFYPK